MEQGDYLRILSPVTNTMANPVYIKGELQYTETTAPLTARKFFESENAQLVRANRADLQHIIEVVRANPLPQHKPTVAPAAPQDARPSKQQPNDLFKH